MPWESLEVCGVGILLGEPGYPRGNGYVEDSNNKLRDLLDHELLRSLPKARYVVYHWRLGYN